MSDSDDEVLNLIPQEIRKWITIRRIRSGEFGVSCDRDDKPATYVWERPSWDPDPDGVPFLFSCESCLQHFVLHVAPKA